MPIADADGLEEYGTKAHMLQGSWTAVSIAANLEVGDAATGNKFLRLTNLGYARRNLGGITERAAVAFNFRPRNLPGASTHTQCLVRFHPELGPSGWYNPPSHFTVKLSPSGRLMLFSTHATSTLIGMGKRPCPVGAFSHLQLMAGRKDGLVEVYLNGILEISVENQVWDPLSSFSVGLTDGSTSSLGAAVDYDDFVTQMGENEDEIRVLPISGVYYIWPRADVAPQDWLLTSGVNAYALINETSPDDDAGYIYATTAGNESAFALTDLPSNIDQIIAMIPVARARKADMGDARLSLGVSYGDAVAYSPEYPISTVYTYGDRPVFETNPFDGQPWTKGAIPNLHIKRTV